MCVVGVAVGDTCFALHVCRVEIFLAKCLSKLMVER
jgi:hypothetical protein